MADMKELMKKLENGVREVATSENWLKYLRFSALFHSYSINNRILIYTQCPTATRVAGFAQWKKINRYVKHGEKGIQIMCPISKKVEVEVEADEDGEEKTIRQMFYRPGYVYDIAQTDGEPVPEICLELTGDVANFEELFNKIVAIAPCPVSFEKISSGAKGYYHRGEKK